MATYARGNPAHWWKGRSCGRGSRAPGAMFIGPLRQWFSIAFLSLLVLLLTGGWYMTRPARISRLAETLLSGLIGGKVTVHSGHVSLSGTLLLTGVTVETQGGPAGEMDMPLPLFSAEQIEARFDWISLLVGELRSTQLTAVRPTLYLIEDHDEGKWNYELLRKRTLETRPAARPSKVAALPVIALREARVQWGEVDNGRLRETASTVVDGQFTPAAESPLDYRFVIAQQAAAPEGAEPPTEAQPVTVTGTWDVADNRLSAATQEIRLTDAVRDTLPEQVRAWWNEHELQGSFSRLWVTFDKEKGLLVGADADHLAMVLKVKPPLGEEMYRVKLTDAHGELTFGITKPSLKVTGFEGRVLGFRFLADGEFGGIEGEGGGPGGADATSALSLDLRFPGAVLGDDYPPLFMMFPASQDLLQRLAPHGTFDLALVIRRAAGDPKILVNGKILCHDARMRFGPFPYPLTHVNGQVDFDQDSVTFQDVIAHANESVVHIDGTTGTSPAHPRIDFKVWSDDAVFDDRMGACLPEKFAQVWDQFVIQARGKFVCTVKRGTDVNVPPDVGVDVTILDGSGYAKAAPYRFYDARGTLLLKTDQTEVRGFTATCGEDHSGRLAVDGVIKHPHGEVENLLPNVKVLADVPIDRALIFAMPEEVAAKAKGVETGGRLGFAGTVERVGGTGAGFWGVHVAGDVGVREGLVRAVDGAWEVSQIRATAQLRNGALRVQTASANVLGGVRVTASGVIDLPEQKAALQIAAEGREVVLPARAPALAPAFVRAAWAAYQPAGKVDVHATASVALGKQDAGATQPFAVEVMPGVRVGAYEYAVTAEGVSLSNAAWPERVEDVRGTVTLTPGSVMVRDLAAKTGPAAISGEGAYDTASGRCTLEGMVTSQGLPVAWMAKLPAGVGEFFNTNTVGGTLVLRVSSLERAAAGAPWKFKADLAAGHFTMSGPVALTAERLGLNSAGTYAGGQVDFNAALTSTNVGIVGKNFDTLGAAVAMSSVDHTLRVTDIDGQVAGGVVQGTIRVEPASAGGMGKYEADLSLKNAELARLILPGGGAGASVDDQKKVGEGRVSGTLALQQTFGGGKAGDRTGRGELLVQDGKIYNVPLAMGLMQVATLRLPVARAFDRAEMSYFLRNNTVTFERILLESPSINLSGAGTLSLKDKGLNLTFVTESPNEIKLPVISPIINTIRAELLQLAVTGTLDNPRVTPVPLSALAAPLRALLPHHQEATGG